MKISLLVVLTSMLLLTACGQNGPLFLPDTSSGESAGNGSAVEENTDEETQSTTE